MRPRLKSFELSPGIPLVSDKIVRRGEEMSKLIVPSILLLTLAIAFNNCEFIEAEKSSSPMIDIPSEGIQESLLGVTRKANILTVTRELETLTKLLKDTNLSKPNPIGTQTGSTLLAQECRSAVDQTCDLGVKENRFSECEILLGAIKWNGFHRLEYDSNGCSSSVTADEFVHKYNINVSNSSDSLTTLYSTVNHSNYKGEKVGGGEIYRRTSSGFELEIIGRRVKLDSGFLSIDQSISSEGPIRFENSNGDRIVSGTVVSNYNRFSYSSKAVIDQLTIDSTCCYPSSGSVQLSFEDDIQGEASVEFQSCGLVKVNLETIVREIQLPACTLK